MAQAANALHSNQVSGAGPGIAQRVVDGDACAEQRRGFIRRQGFRDPGHRFAGSDHVLLIPAVEVDRRNFREFTVDEIAAAAGIALEAVSAVPTDAHALARLPQSDFGADSIDKSGDLVAGNAWILQPRPHAFFYQRIAVADTARFHLDTHLSAARLGNGSFDDFEISTCFADLNGFHEDLLSRGKLM